MGARLEYILIPLAGGFGMAIVPMVGTNWGARQYRRAREIGWTGGATVAAACATVGLTVALFPQAWMGLFSQDNEIIRVGTSHLRILGPIYGFYGLGMALFFAAQGLGSVVLTVTANALRLAASAGRRTDRHLLARLRRHRIFRRRRARVLCVRDPDRMGDGQDQGSRRDAAMSRSAVHDVDPMLWANPTAAPVPRRQDHKPVSRTSAPPWATMRASPEASKSSRINLRNAASSNRP
jgi:MatE